MTFDYSDRQVPIAFVGGVTRLLASDGTPIVAGKIQFSLSDKDGGIQGPKVDVTIHLRDEKRSLEDTELALLAAAHAALRRLAGEPDANLPLAMEDNRKKAAWAPPPP